MSGGVQDLRFSPRPPSFPLATIGSLLPRMGLPEGGDWVLWGGGESSLGIDLGDGPSGVDGQCQGSTRPVSSNARVFVLGESW